MPNRVSGLILVFVATVLWGASGVFIKFFPHIDSLSLVWSRNFIGAIFFGAYAVFQLKTLIHLLQTKKKLTIFLNTLYLLGTIGFFTLAVKTGTVTSAAFLLYVMPLFVSTLYGLFVEKRPVSGWLSVALAFCAVGVVAISLGNFSDKVSLSNIWGILAGLSWGLQMLESRKLGKEYPTQIGLAMIFALAALVTVPFTNFHSILTEPRIGLLITYGIVSTVVAPLAFYAGIKYVNPTDGGIVSLFDPLFAAVAAFLVLGEIPTFGILIGSVFIVIGNMLQVFSPEAKLPEMLSKLSKGGSFVQRYRPGNIGIDPLKEEQVLGFSYLFLYFKHVKEKVGEKEALKLLGDAAIERRKTWYKDTVKSDVLENLSSLEKASQLFIQLWNEVNPFDSSKEFKVDIKPNSITITTDVWCPICEAAELVSLSKEKMCNYLTLTGDDAIAKEIDPSLYVTQTIHGKIHIVEILQKS